MKHLYSVLEAENKSLKETCERHHAARIELSSENKRLRESLSLIAKAEANYGPNLDIDPTGADVIADLDFDQLKFIASEALNLKQEEPGEG